MRRLFLALGVVALLSGLSAVPSSAGAVNSNHGDVQGHIYDQTNGEPIVGGCATIVFNNGFRTSFSTGSDGFYRMNTVRTGAWQMFAGFCGASPPHAYVPEVFRHQTGLDNCCFEPVNILSNVYTSGINFTLQRGGTINVTVLEEGTGTPLANVLVCPNYKHKQAQSSFCAITNSSGVVALRGVPADPFYNKVRAFDLTGSHAAEWYNNKANDFETANRVQVAVDDSTDITMRLAPSAPTLAARTGAAPSGDGGWIVQNADGSVSIY